MKCNNCGADMKYIKEGRSKNPPYKPYNAFWSCPACKHTENIEPTETASSIPTPPEPSSQTREPINQLGVAFTEHNLNKRAALDKATQLAIAIINTGKTVIASEVVSTAEVFANFIEDTVE